MLTNIKDIIRNPIAYVNERIRLRGWIDVIRQQKKATFINLRDDYKILQLFIKSSDLEKTFGREDYVEVSGIFKDRSVVNYNLEFELGVYELVVEQIDIISKVLMPIPFYPSLSSSVSDNIRYEYRYIDLRCATSIEYLIFRRDLKQFLRHWFMQNDFLEIDTPLLTSTSPEGARDYIVLSAKLPGHGYALPQSPQLYKQILMSSGVKRYYQIAPCFRDEDTRRNRLAGEFYQIDVESSEFTTRANIIKHADSLLDRVFNYFSPHKKVIRGIMKYADSMRIFHSDKPDLRLLNFHNISVDSEMIKLEFAPDNLEKMHQYIDELNHLKIEFSNSMSLISVVKKLDTYSILCEITDKIYTNLISLCYVVDFPLFIPNEQGENEFSHNPFSKCNVEENTTEQFDIVANGQEICSGSVRNTDPILLKQLLEQAGYKNEDIERFFGNFIRSYSFGSPQHGGFAIGFERLCTIIRGGSIRDYVAFPLSQSGKDLLFDFPFPLSILDLALYDLKINRKTTST